ncbi:MAG: hypothetical protein OQJ99_05455 [Rhodospirillales bacterium]|nr:hypothetical protein [Rhodospirillales bacterium]MCW8862043.1 hypothetical protein [Rhodospirillales bacterium]MCW8970466.1 hypothetical protein [Rhodospirillales bacterium]MCW9002965.1 hypothetical protein [Rhodospirillales bacterium]MCW9040663.1 hypothetical protein [Rhodospirillales bacterium]
MSAVSQNIRQATEVIRQCINSRGGYGYCPAQGIEDAQTDICPNRLDLLRAALRLMARCECSNRDQCKARDLVSGATRIIESVEDRAFARNEAAYNKPVLSGAN